MWWQSLVEVFNSSEISLLVHVLHGWSFTQIYLSRFQLPFRILAGISSPNMHAITLMCSFSFPRTWEPLSLSFVVCWQLSIKVNRDLRGYFNCYSSRHLPGLVLLHLNTTWLQFRVIKLFAIPLSWKRFVSSDSSSFVCRFFNIPWHILAYPGISWHILAFP